MACTSIAHQYEVEVRFCKPKERGADHGSDVCAGEQTIVSTFMLGAGLG